MTIKERNLRNLEAVIEMAEDKAEWLERRIDGIRVDAMLAPLPVGFEFRLGPYEVGRAYSGLYRKNAEGLWDQVEGTCEPPHVLNFSPDHLGFVLGPMKIRAALAVAVVVARVLA